MYKLKLIKGRSYTGYGVTATSVSPIVDVESEETAKTLIASKYFSVISETAEIEKTTSSAVTATAEKPLNKMTEKELEAYAAENGIELTGLKKKADKLSAIQQALESAELFADEE